MFTKRLLDHINTELCNLCDKNYIEIKENLKLNINNEYIIDRLKEMRLFTLKQFIHAIRSELNFEEKRFINEQDQMLMMNKLITEEKSDVIGSILDKIRSISANINNYKIFIEELSKKNIYSFDKNFLHDYLNYPLNVEYLKNQDIYFDGRSILIYTGDINIIDKYNLIYLYKNELDIFEVKPEYNLTIVLKNIDINEDITETFFINKPCDASFNLKTLWDTSSENENENDYFIKILKLILYIQSSNVDLRLVKPLIQQSNTRKERDRANNFNYINDSLIEYYKVGYSWKKLPLYTQNEWEVKGHFRMQPCGEKRSNYKLIFIEPQLRKRNELKF